MVKKPPPIIKNAMKQTISHWQKAQISISKMITALVSSFSVRKKLQG